MQRIAFRVKIEEKAEKSGTIGGYETTPCVAKSICSWKGSSYRGKRRDAGGLCVISPKAAGGDAVAKRRMVEIV